jgi:APA family basic amino acid/polyamine antiporter
MDGHDLKRTLKLFPATNLVVANMIGAGIFTTSGLLLRELGSPLLMLALWAAGGALALLGALCYGELGAAMPRAGGEYVYLSELFHPVFGFLTGWVSFFAGFSAPLAASALGFSAYVASAVPATVGWGHPDLARQLLAIVAIGGLTLVHVRGIEFGSRVQNVLTVGKVALILGLVVAGFALGQGDVAHFREGAAIERGIGGWKTAGLSLMWIMFAYSGWNAAAYIGSEIERPERNLPRSLLLGTGVVLLLYLGLNALYVYAIPPADMVGVIPIGGAATSRLFGRSAETVIALLIAFALLSSLSAIIIIGPRVYYAMARDGYFFRAVSEVHPRFRVPAKAIVLQSLLAIVMVMTGTFDQILTYMGFCLGIFPILAAMGIFRLRRTGTLPYRMPGHPVVPLAFAVVSVLILVLGYLERPVESSVALLTVAAGVPVYFVFRRSRQRHSQAGGT